MKVSLVLDPPWEIHEKVGIGWNLKEDGTKQPMGGCDYVFVDVECEDEQGVQWLIDLLKDRFVEEPIIVDKD